MAEFKVGDKVRLRGRYAGEEVTVPPGTIGSVSLIGGREELRVDFKSGPIEATLDLLESEIELVPSSG